jgi:hypothetical protein
VIKYERSRMSKEALREMVRGDCQP